jgi:protein PsiE
MRAKIDRFGGVLFDGFHYLALFAIGGAVVRSAIHAFIGMAGKGYASIDDILLLFIYLELVFPSASIDDRR